MGLNIITVVLQKIRNPTSTSYLILFRQAFLEYIPQIFLVGCPRGEMVKAMDCGIVKREFELQPRYYIHFRTNTLGRGMNPFILSAMG